MKKIFTCLAVVFGAIIGAGYASGRELFDYYVQYGSEGIIGIILTNVFFGVLIWFVLFLAQTSNIERYQMLIKHSHLRRIIQLFSATSFCIMISAVGTFFYQQFHLSFWVGAGFAMFICYVLLKKRFLGIKQLSNILVPLILLGIIVMCIWHYDIAEGTLLRNYGQGSGIVASLVYTGYHFLILIPLLIECGETKLQDREIWLTAVLFVLINSTMMFMLCRVLKWFYPIASKAEFPILEVAVAVSGQMRFVYCLLLIGSILTTAISSGYNFVKLGKEENYSHNVLAICIVSLFVSKIGFSRLMQICYPFFGILGWVQIFLLGSRKVIYEKE